ncbi:formate dehydrogenase accessory sulfurtransferase FdhD [Mariniblastus fucicola]|uniref:Sulfur carrier protein FdhD n=1 Tax=Mariniblastus fucicola TaxID=980251 RepID=A0A5B9PEH4_9BACT|nr:formate dehydrogenase accessory sulfurtransferase FdhD [Mariniblastus fucicola]QEG22976.1 formate dehydrogenase accessory protein [Mariniblastus fucicola]
MTESNSNPELRRKSKSIIRFENGAFTEKADFLAVEEPLEIRIVYGSPGNQRNRSLSITMRTPGHDRELAAGFLLGEGIVTSADQITQFELTGPKDECTGLTNQLCVHVAEGVSFDFGSLQRNFYTTSSCGICGKASLDAVRAQLTHSVGFPSMKVSASLIASLPSTMRERQSTFDETGGLHAAGLFATDGKLVACYEDVGRHNALDKLVGFQCLAGRLRESESLALVSGRASFELVQKVISAGIPILVAVGAPSSLAAELADEFGVTLVGFASKNRFNIYSHSSRLIMDV